LLTFALQYFICPISTIHHRDLDYDIPMGGEGRGGDYTLLFKRWLTDIMYGNEKHEWAVEIDEMEGMI
jgi:branched-chain amino acid aminotransferase